MISLKNTLNAIATALQGKTDLPTIGSNYIEIGDVLIQWGENTISAYNNQATKQITFPRAFSTVPNVQVTLTDPWSNYGVYCGSQYTTTTTVLFVGINRQATSAMPISWLAIGKK